MTTQVRVSSEPAIKRVAGARSRAADRGADDGPLHRNEVTLVGRLVAAAESKQLPSGDEIVNWRLTIDRVLPDGSRRFDVIGCTTFGARLRRQALGWEAGEVVEITGALRHRFWRGVGGLQSRTEVEVATAKRVKSPPASRGGAARRPRTPG